MATRTINFLPKIFQTDHNKKFLNATLDQFTTEPNVARINGYVGHKTSPAYVYGDNYLIEPSIARQQYQLEPSIVVKEPGKDPVIGNYNDIVDAIDFAGGYNIDHDTLFANKFYSYDGQFDFDKFVNHTQYYWLPYGPNPVVVSATGIVTINDFAITRNANNDVFDIQDYVQPNPTLILARGSTYTFNVNQTGSPFWIQAATGTSGEYPWQTNLSAREVYGVANNGTDNGTITYHVPARGAQDWILQLAEQDDVNYATTLNYAQIQGQTVDNFLSNYGGIDGVQDLRNKVIVFVNNSLNDADWTDPTHPATVINSLQRTNTFIIRINDDGSSAPTLDVQPWVPVQVNYKFKVLGGNVYGYRYFYKNPTSSALELLPAVTADLDVLYYQDANATGMVGAIKLVDVYSSTPIDVEKDILQQQNYSSPNGVDFTNGLKVRFDSTVKPIQYQNKDFYVEGVGDAIRLVPTEELITPETYVNTVSVDPWDESNWDTKLWDANTSGPTVLDYITINRASRDRNAWSRSNRWFHIDVINAVAKYNNYTIPLDQLQSAKRPIIEFNYDLQLVNSGRVYKQAIDVFDTVTTDALSNVEGTSSYTVDGIQLTDGVFVVFAADTDPDVSNKVYKVNKVDPSGDNSSITHLTLVEHATVLANETVLVKFGNTNQGKMIWFDGSVWHVSQQKTQVNQTPLFDVFDDVGISYRDTNKYPSSSFAGTKIFSYAVGTGKADVNLGFALSYKSIQNIGDIVFNNNFDADTFSYVLDNATITNNINYGKLHSNTSLTTYNEKTVWVTAINDSKQFQHLEYTATANQNEFLINNIGDISSYVNNFKLLVNNKPVSADNYVFESINGRNFVVLNTGLSENDKVDIFIYAKNTIVPNAYYQIPDNLQVNPANQEAPTFTLGQLRRHTGKIYENSKQTMGVYLGPSNLRDLPKIKNVGGTLLQNSASMIPVGLFLTHPDINILQSIQHAATEYSRFKNKILDQAIKLTFDDSDTAATKLDKILAEINAVKTDQFAWYYSDMLAYGTDSVANTTTITIDNDAQLEYDLYTKFDLTQTSRRAVYVYVNDVQLTLGKDYVFLSIRPAIALTAGTIAVDDVLKIVEYSTTNGSYIPETPSKMGLYPSYVPRIYTDDTFVESTTCIEGHDGSITPAFGDFRDQILLEFELRIYNNIKVQWNLDKISLYDAKSGAFRSVDYTLEQYNNILAQYFSTWAGKYGLDYTTNNTFLSNNTFTYNYKRTTDRIFHLPLQGSWRAIFDYFYDTTRPHTHPWEMLGFNKQPDWWQKRYGAAPYTSGNLVLWEDLRDGRIFYGPRQGIDARFARPNLLDLIPTDEYGQLRTPVEIFTENFDSKKTSVSWAFGDIGPVEAAWRRSSEFAFANQAALIIMKPAKYLGLYIDNDSYVFEKSINEFTFNGQDRRLKLTDYQLNSEVYNNTAVSKASYANWVIDKLTANGISGVTKLRNIIDNTSVNLTYSFAGYTGMTLMNSFAEQASPNAIGKSILVPEDNQQITVKKSVPQYKIIYSAVIIEKTGTGYKVQGYDLTRPYFTIIPSLANSNNYTISVLNTSATIYQDYTPVKTIIPYGTEFVNKQQVVDFLVSYGRYLTSQGVQFSQYDNDLATNRNFVLSAQEFLNWSLQGWGSQTVIVLNPLSEKVRLIRAGYTVDEVNGTQVGASKVLDQNFNYLRNDQFNIVRIGNDFSINAVNSNIAMVEMNLIQYEHAIIYDNTTIFNDVIYEPQTGNRQERIKIIGFKTREWNGTVYAPGFVYNSDTIDVWTAGQDYGVGSLVEFKNQYYQAKDDIAGADSFQYSKWEPYDKTQFKSGLLPNFNNLSARIENYYSVDNANFEAQLDLYSKGLIGFRPRNYLTELGIEDTSQIRFYQGYINAKGTSSALNALLGAKFDRFTTEIDAYENWAFRVGEYGALDSTQYIELALPEQKFASNPSFLELLNNGDSSDTGAFGYSPNGSGDSKIVYVPKNYTKHLFLTTGDRIQSEDELRTAGYLKPDQVTGTLFDIENIAVSSPLTFMDSIGSGYILWVAKKANKDWTALRADQTAVQVINITNALDGNLAVTTSDRHNLQANDYIAIKNFDANFNFIYKVQSVSDLKTFIIHVNTNLGTDLTGFNSLDGTGVLYKFSPVRFNTIADWAAYSPKEGWQTNDIAAIDKWGTNYFDWAVFKKQDIWDLNQTVNSWDATSNQQYGSAVAFINSGDYMLTSAPSESTGKVFVYKKDLTGQYQQLTSLTRSDSGLSGFGTAITASNANYFAVGSPDSNTNTGYVHIYKINTSNDTISLVGSAIAGPSTTADFARSISFSKDGNWLYVGAPGVNRVYVYGLSGTTFYQVGTYITPADASSGDKFGWSVSASTDGAQVLVGSPFNDTGATDSGAVYIYDRSIEAFIGDGSSTVCTLLRSPATNVKTATIDGVVQTGVTYTGSGNKTVTFTSAPANGSLIKIHSNNFQLLKKLIPTGQVNQQFGYSTVLCPYDCTAYVGAPQNDKADNNYNVGTVYRFTNMGRLYGSFTGTVTNPTVTTGHGIRINDFDVVFTGTSLSSVVTNINNKNIPGVTATSVNNKLFIQCDVVLVADKLRILPGSGTALTDLGLDVFTLTQTINNPNPVAGDQFGTSLAISSDATKLAVASNLEGTVEITTFDSGMTTFDVKSLILKETVGQSGAVLVYEYVHERVDNNTRPGVFILDKFLEPGALKLADNFGASIAMTADTIASGATGLDKFGSNYGGVFVFKASDTSAWQVDGQAVPRLDTNSINRLYLYNTTNKTKLIDLDFLDPIKGKVPGQALAEIDYIEEIDPAVYGDTATSKNEIWGSAQVGKVWWNTDTVRYINYEQGDFQFRSTNWGNTFPGSTIEVYEWTSSMSLPSQYVAANGNNFDGYPAFDDTKVVSESKIDITTGITVTNYYYWVRRKTTANADAGRNLTVSAIEDLISNPKGQGLSYAAIMADNMIGLYNVATYLSGSDTLLHVDYDVQPNSDVIHAEYDLVQEGNASSKPADLVLTKLIDSLAGQDVMGLVVPDTSLYGDLKYGIGNRPRQSMFINRLAALQAMLDSLNTIFDQYKLIEIYDIAKLVYAEPVPNKAYGLWDLQVANLTEKSYVNTGILSNGYKLLVLSDSDHNSGWTIYTLTAGNWVLTRQQAYNLSKFWTYKDYVKSGYDNTKLPTHNVDNRYDLQRYSFNINDTIKIMNNGSGRYEIVQYIIDSDNNKVFDTVVLENGTINFTDELYTQSLINDGSTLSQNYSKEIRGLFDLLFNDLFTGQLQKHCNQLFFTAIRYILREQKHADWLFKTSLIDIKHYFRKLEQQSVYLKDNQTFLLDYINETKPYHTKIREYLLNYTGNEPWLGDPTDFDLPAYYDTSLEVFRSPSGEELSDTYRLENELQYRMWDLNYKYGVSQILVEDGGKNYLIAPSIVFTTAPGDSGSGARGYAVVSEGKLSQVVITDPGINYKQPPMVTAVTDSTLDSGSGAKLYAQIGNNPIRKLKTILRFDRYTYNTAVLVWASSHNYLTGQYVTYKNVLYRVDSNFTSGTTFTSDYLTKVTDQDLSALNDGDFGSANDRIRAYYAPKQGMPGVTSNFTMAPTWTANTTYLFNSYVQHNLQLYKVVKHFTSGSSFSTTDSGHTVLSPSSEQFDFSQLQSGLDFSGTKVEARYFSDLPKGMDLPSSYPTIASGLDDTVITSDFIDAELGTRAEDILVDGDGFISPINSYGPEELMPGRIYDTLNMQVHTIPRTDYNTIVTKWTANHYYTKGSYLTHSGTTYQAVKNFISQASFSIHDTDGSTLVLAATASLTAGAGPNITSFSYVGDGSTVTYTAAVAGTYDDVMFVYTKIRGIQQENKDYTVDYKSRTITFTFAPELNDSIYISVQNHGGNYLLYDKTYSIATSTNQIILDTEDTTVKDILVFVNGVRMFEGVASNQFTHLTTSNLYTIGFNTNLSVGDFVHVYVYIQPATYREIHNTYRSYSNMQSVNYPADYTIALDRTLKTSQPYHQAIIVEVNGSRLRPPHNSYFTGDASTTHFTPSYPTDVNGATASGNDIEVYQNGVRKGLGVDYTLTALDGSTIRTVIFNTAPDYLDKVVISVTTNAEFSIASNSSILISSAVVLNTQSSVRVIDYADHDSSLIRTTVFVGTTGNVSSLPHGFDEIGFDSEDAGFDSTSTSIIALPRYALQYVHKNINYVYVTKNGAFLQPNIDFNLVNSGTSIDLLGSVKPTDVIVVTEFTENSQRGTISFRMFKNLLDQTNFYSIWLQDSTQLTADLGIFDTQISVANASVCPAPGIDSNKPGIVFVNGERIAYWERDTVNNKLSRIIRSTGGTGAPTMHKAGTDVVSAGKNQEITSIYDNPNVSKWQPNTLYYPNTYILYQNTIYQVSVEFTSGSSFGLTAQDGSTIALVSRAQFRDTVWYDMNNKNQSIVEVNTVQANFLRQKEGFIPT